MTGEGRSRRPGAELINVVLGVWVIVSPVILGFAQNQTAKWNDIATGIAMALLAIKGGSWWNVTLGIWLIVSPFVLGFSNAPVILWNNVILGVLVAIVALLRRSAGPVDYGGPTPPPPPI